ncbi:MAG TPA: hypothetical protein VG797_11545 [Phycisphaerales bacterium]|nr:hypothetical protein [Phycisphaerales bacterium]
MDTALLTKANELAGPLSGTTDAAAELGPALVAMQPAPAFLKTVTDATLLTPKSPKWSEADAWAAGEPQKKVLEALAKVTDPKSKYMFSLKYGAAATNPDWVKAGFFIDLSDPPTLAAAKFNYLKTLDEMGKLITIEAARRASSDNAKGSLELLTQWLRFSRMMADREFRAEKEWAFRTMLRAAERIRDLLYQNDQPFTPEMLIDTNKEIAERKLLLHRIKFPEGDRIAAQQLIVRTILERGGPNPDTFAATLARLGSADRPLMLFGEAAYWGQVEANHAGWFDTRDELERVHGDWKKRWDLDDPHDMMMRLPTDFSRMDKVRYSLIDLVGHDLGGLIRARELLYLELSGTRMAVAVVGFKLAQSQWPPNIKAVQPKFIPENELDIYNFNASKNQFLEFRYWVPIRDQQWGPRDQPKPYAIGVVPFDDQRTDLNSGATDLRRMVSTFLFTYFLVDRFPKEIYDPGAGTLDVPQLRTVLKAIIDRGRVTPDELNEINDRVKSVTSGNSEPTKAAEAIKKTFERLGKELVGSSGADPKIAIGLTDEEWGAYIAQVVGAVTASKAWGDALTRVQSQKQITAPEYRAIRGAWVDAALRDDLIEPYVKKFFPHIAASGVDSDRMFFKAVDDKQCLLYSVGLDGKDDRARSVGDGGLDILYWPPIVSLVREQLAGDPSTKARSELLDN